ncbi:hypothetical protein PISMIDRAFT_19397, partial [Pisolithus microcarpus 441]
ATGGPELAHLNYVRDAIGVCLDIALSIVPMTGTHHVFCRVLEIATLLINVVVEHAKQVKRPRISADIKTAISEFAKEMKDVQEIMEDLAQRTSEARRVLSPTDVRIISSCANSMRAVCDTLRSTSSINHDFGSMDDGFEALKRGLDICTIEVRSLGGYGWHYGMNMLDLSSFPSIICANGAYSVFVTFSVVPPLYAHPKPFLNKHDVPLLLDVLPTAHDHPDLSPTSPLLAALSKCVKNSETEAHAARGYCIRHGLRVLNESEVSSDTFKTETSPDWDMISTRRRPSAFSADQATSSGGWYDSLDRASSMRMDDARSRPALPGQKCLRCRTATPFAFGPPRA